MEISPILRSGMPALLAMRQLQAHYEALAESGQLSRAMADTQYVVAVKRLAVRPAGPASAPGAWLPVVA